MKKLVVGLCALLSVTLFSCSEDEEPDLRLPAIGEYSGTAKFYYVDGSALVDLDEDENVDFEVTIGSNNTLTIDVEGDDFTATKIKEATNGFAFDINNKTIDGIAYSGYQGVELGSSKYDGRFEKNSERLTFFVQYVYDGITFVIRIQGDI